MSIMHNLVKYKSFCEINYLKPIVPRHVDEEAQQLLTDYRDRRARKKMLDNKAIYKRYEIEWIGREGLAPETHEEYLNDFINHFYKNVLRLIDRAMKKEDTSEQGRIVTELMQHLHGCKNNCDVFFGRTEELEKMQNYIVGESNKPFVMYGAGGSGKSSMLSMTGYKALNEWLSPAKPLLFVRFCGTTPNSTSLGPLLKSICQQISYTFMLPFEDIPDDTVPVTAFLKELLNLATKDRPFLIFFDSIDELTGSQETNTMAWLPLKLPPHCKFVVSVTCEDGKQETLDNLKCLQAMIEDQHQFLEVTELGKELAWRVTKLWMKTAGRDLNNYQWRTVANAFDHCTLPIFCKLVFQEVCRWKSYFEPELTVLRYNVMDSVFQLFERVENKHGWMLVSHALSYITASKNGVSEPEIEDFISLDDKVLDDIYQYHLPPNRRIPPLLWTRVRSDLPGYLADSEADGVCVINWYHKQFKIAAKERYFVSKEEYLYFHSYMADYFLGTYGGGIRKPFRYTEIQKHMFRLKSKDSSADREVPAQPLAFYNKQGKITRYNLRKFSELPFQLVRCYRYKDLYDHVLFNYRWLFAKMSALPLNEVLGDFEDAVLFINDPIPKKEINLVADSIRLGGAILKHYPEMLAAQLNGRLMPERQNCSNIKRLLDQCDEEGVNHNALVPTFHCMHTPGGPLKYSLEGHQFAIFAMRLSSDKRYIVSVSNRFITFDVVTSDLARQVYPGVEGLMLDLELSADDKYAAAYTSNNQIILLNTLISEFTVIENPFKAKNDGEQSGSVQGLKLLEGRLVVVGQTSWIVFDMFGKQISTGNIPLDYCIFSLKMLSLERLSIISWTGHGENPDMGVQSMVSGKWGSHLTCHSAVVLNNAQNRAFLCHEKENFTVSCFKAVQENWEKAFSFEINMDKLLMISLSKDEKWCIGTIHKGFKLWHVGGKRVKTLILPSSVRNVNKSFGVSYSLILSAEDKYAVAGIRKELYIWSLETEVLSKVLNAHFQRIIDICSLVQGKENSIITSSIDRSIKVWNLNYIFEEDHHIDKHELTIDSISISTKAGIAVTVTRSCVGIWDFRTGKLKFTLANTALGAIVTHAVVNDEGDHVAAAESGEILYWNVNTKSIVFREKLAGINQMELNKHQDKCLIGASAGNSGNLVGRVIIKSFPEGEKILNVEYPFKKFLNVLLTSDESHVVCCGTEKGKAHLFLFNLSNSDLAQKILLKYNGFKEINKLVVLPDKPGLIGLIDSEKGNIFDIVGKKLIKSVPCWDGSSSSDGKYGLYAPPSGGMDILDLRSGSLIRTLIPKIAEGIFDVIATFSQTNEYVLYYHSGRKTIRVFRRKDGTQIANYRVSADLKCMETTRDGRSLVLGMGDGAITTLTIADPAKSDTKDYLKSLPSRSEGSRLTKDGSTYLQNGNPYPDPYDYSIYTDYLKVLHTVVPDK